ncbi:MAG: carbonic anhydrase [Desulfobacca sp.]|nr:carbonic anhydrase [Desulfobacca sp.]
MNDAATTALNNLLAGNQRFVRNEPAPQNFIARRQELLAGQQPVAIVLGCSDSRVPPELLFDQGLGDIFVVRTAGQVLEATTIASIEYAVDHLHTPLLMILGHDNCGGVTAAVTHECRGEGNIGVLFSKILPSLDRARKIGIPAAEFIEAVTDFNLDYLAEQLFTDSPIIRAAVTEGRCRMVGAKYFLGSGEVKILTPNYQPSD